MTCTSDSDDLNSVRRCLAGDTGAFDELVVRYQKMVYNAALHIVRNREDALEIAQGVFLKAFRNLESFDPERRFFSWIYRIAINDSLNFVAAAQRRELSPVPDPPAAAASPEEVLEAREAVHHVDAILGRLAPEQRAVVVLRHFVGCSYHEAAEILGIPEKTYKSRLYEARQTLREELSALGYGPRRTLHDGRNDR